MTFPKPLSASERSAREILAAWNSGDVVRLRSVLGHAGPTFDGASAAEQERFEMIGEIAANLRAWMDNGSQREDLDASLALLRHLAQANGTRWASAAARRYEMPAYVLN